MAKRSTWHGIFQVFRFAKRHWVLIGSAFLVMAMYAASEGAFLVLMKPFVNAAAGRAKAVRSTVLGQTGADDGTADEGGGEPEERAVPGDDAAATAERVNAKLTVEGLYRIGKLALLLAPIIALTAFGQYYLNGRVLWRLTVDLRDAVCCALMPQSLSFFEDRRSGDLMSRITNDVARSTGAFRQLFAAIPEHAFHFVIGVTLALIYQPVFVLLSVLTVPLVVLPVGYMARKIRRYGREGLEKLADLTDLMAQMFSGIRVIKAFKMEDAEVEEFQRTNQRFLRKMLKMVSARGFSAGTVELIVRGFMGGAILFITWWFIAPGMAAGKTLDFGDLVVAIGGMYYAFQAMRRLIKAYNMLQECIPATDRIFELIEHVPTIQDAPDATALAGVERGIAFRDVSFGYNRETVLTGVSFEVARGRTVAAVGRSGAGKSTLVALIPRLYDVTSGVVEIDGMDVRRITRDSLLDRVAIVAQQTFLFNRSIAENIRYGRRDAAMEEVEQAARAANIHDFVTSLPEGYDTLCGEFGSKLSGGQAQRIAIARALLKNPDILILDEAMAGLDAESESLVREALANLMRGRTTFVITHDLQTIRNADAILVLRDGALVEMGTHKELMAQDGEYRSLHGMQF